MILGDTEFSYLDEITIHRFKNIYGQRSVSLHLYSKPIEKWRVYTEGSKEVEIKELHYDSSHEGTL